MNMHITLALRDDDIKDDSVCARRIFRVTKQSSGNGFSAWLVLNIVLQALKQYSSSIKCGFLRAAWKERCQNQDVKSYLSHCKDLQ